MNKILITGKTGTVGSNLHFGIGFPSSDYDLKDKRQTEELFEHVNPDAVVHCAASVGGLGFHLEQKYKLFYENLIMGLNVINCAKERKTKRVLSFLSACVFSEKCPQPVDESQVHENEPFFLNYYLIRLRFAFLTVSHNYLVNLSNLCFSLASSISSYRFLSTLSALSIRIIFFILA